MQADRNLSQGPGGVYQTLRVRLLNPPGGILGHAGMVSRTILLLIPVVVLAAVTFRWLVQAEVERVASVHVTHKAVHLMDMLLAEGQTIEALHEAGRSAGFRGMARSSNVASIFWFDKDGKLLTETVGAQPSAHDHSFRHADHAGPDHAAQTKDRGHNHHQIGLDVDDQVLSEIAGLEAPGADELQSLLGGGIAPITTAGTLGSDPGARIAYGRVSLPAYSDAGAFLGVVTFTFSVNHIFAAMSVGAQTFGIMFTLFGAVLFGIPAVAYWAQKQMAIRSARDVGFLSRHDTLTGLLNRQTFTEAANGKNADRLPNFIGYIDVDRFKLINDTYGHNAGDAFLKHIANLLRDRLGSSALISRFGGDEFTFAVYYSDRVEAQVEVEKLKRDAGQQIEIDGVSVSSTISIGIAERHGEEDLESALQRADTALYFAKSEGRNAIALYDEKMGAAAKRRRDLEALLRQKSSTGGFELAFQPLVDAKSKSTLGYEALLRLKDKNGVPVPPSEFVPLAEETGLIEEIGHWVLFNAMHQISQLDDTSCVSINLSAEQFKSGKLVASVEAALRASGLPARRLELEITESVLLSQDTQVEFQIDALKEMGISIAMDDFGTGFSSLSTLWRYGFDRIKIDKSFIHAIEEAPQRSQQLIDTIILLGARMGMSVTAEGVETRAQHELLTALGCDVLQGFYFGKPAPLVRPAPDSDIQAAE